MNKYEALLIRACKSLHPTKRLESFYRKFYVKGDERVLMIRELNSQLGRICDKYNLIRSSEWINEMSSSCDWKYRGSSYEERVLRLLINKIAFTEVSKFDNLPIPRKFRSLL